MKRILGGILLFIASIFIVSYLTKKASTEDPKKSIDKKLVHSLTGSWVANSYDYGNYKITYDENTLRFNSTKLEIDYTEDDSVFTHQRSDKTFHYIFKIKDGSIIVYPSFEVDQTSDELVVGGDLAPIVLKKEQILSKESILGRWKSSEADNPAFIQLRATFERDKVDLLIEQTESTEGIEMIPLTFESGDSELIYFNQDRTIKYVFSCYEKTKLMIHSSSTKKDVEGTARPWILERVVD